MKISNDFNNREQQRLIAENAQQKQEISDLKQLINRMNNKMDSMNSNLENLSTVNEEIKSSNEEIKATNQEIITINRQIKTTVDELKLENEEMHGHVKTVLRRERSPAPIKPIKTSYFAVMLLNNDNPEEKKYAMIRRKAETFETQVKKIKLRHPRATMLMDKIQVPDAPIFGDNLQRTMKFKKNQRLEFDTRTNDDEELKRQITEAYNKLKTEIDGKKYESDEDDDVQQ